jgi:hypothetical protein
MMFRALEAEIIRSDDAQVRQPSGRCWGMLGVGWSGRWCPASPEIARYG